MNLNAAIYGNAIDGMMKDFHISTQVGRVGQCVFLICYAFGCELWAPWSEELGRWWVLQTSLFFVNIWQIPAALAPNFGTMAVARALGGLSSAGGSVTLGMVADMWRPADQQFAVAYVVLSSVGGSVLGPVVGGFIGEYANWRWVFYVQLAFGVFAQLIHWFVPETRSTTLLDKEAKRRRKEGEDLNVYGPDEIKGNAWQRLTKEKLFDTWTRPFKMFLTEPIVLCLSVLSGFSDALIFTFLESYSPVFGQWGFNKWQLGLAFTPLLVGYFLAYLIYLPDIFSQEKYMKEHGEDNMAPERRLRLLLWLVPLEAIGLFAFSWTSLGPDYGIPWIVPLIFSALVGIANYAIYYATIDYMIAAYGPYAASATGGNGFARDFLAGVAAMYSMPFYEIIPKYRLELPSTILGVLATLFSIPVYWFYMKGPQIRGKSKFAQTLASERKEYEDRRQKKIERGSTTATTMTATGGILTAEQV